jgi:hypothetical protein
VRALLTLIILAVVIVTVARGQEVESLWTETLLIALAHYFTSRRFLYLSPEALGRLESEGVVEKEANPLYLPRHSIRISVVLAFTGLAVFLYREDRLVTPQALSILGIVFAYLLGVVWRGGRALLTRGSQRPTARWWDDVKALVVLLVLAVTAAAYLADRTDLVPPQLRSIPLGLVLFYFGSR